jgi:hypothetical protein
MNLRWPVLCGLLLCASASGEEDLLANATRWQGADFAALFPAPTVEAAGISRVAAIRRFEVCGIQPMAVNARFVEWGRAFDQRGHVRCWDFLWLQQLEPAQGRIL